MSDCDFLTDSRSPTPPETLKPLRKMPSSILYVIHQSHESEPPQENAYAAGWTNVKRFTFPIYLPPPAHQFLDTSELTHVDREGMEAIDEILATLNQTGDTWTLAHVNVGATSAVGVAGGCARSIVVVVEKVVEDNA